MAFGWESSLGWLAFLSLIPFLIAYLIKPKPKELEVPSLMFFMKSGTKDRRHSFFKTLATSWLFFLQLLLLVLLSLFFIKPYTTLGSDLFVDHAVILVDISASTQANDGAVFKRIIKEATENLGRSNTIILISNVPRTGVKEVSKSDAKRYLKSLRPTDGRSSIGEAILLAERYATGEGDKVVVISDFLTTGTADIALAKDALTDKGIAVEFLPVRAPRQLTNVGIVDLVVGKEESTLFIENFNAEETTVPLHIGSLSDELTLQPKYVEAYTFATPQSATLIILDIHDDFSADNTAYLTLPGEQSIKVLLLSDAPSLYLQAAVTSLEQVTLDIVRPDAPRKGYDAYIIAALREDLHPRVVDLLAEEVAAGAGLVVHVQEDSPGIQYGRLLPLTLSGIRGSSVVTTEHILKFTKDIAFGSVVYYFATSQEKGLIVATVGDDTILSVDSLGEGKLVYYGILEDRNDFKLSPSYPIFWANLLQYLADAESIKDVNVPTGSLLALPTEKEVTTPSGTITTDLILFDEQGIYQVDGETYAASLVNALESNINRPSAFQESAAVQTAANQEGTFKQDLSTLLIIVALLLLFVELLATKLRGEV